MSTGEKQKLLSMRQYALRRGVSVEAVSKAVKAGRISLVTDERGIKKINPEKADLEWAANSDPSKVRRREGHEQHSAGKSSAPLKIFSDDDDQDGDAAEDDEDGGHERDYYKSKAEAEHYKAKTAKLTYEERIKELVSFDGVKKRWLKVANTVKGKVLGIPSKAKQRCPDLTSEQYAELEMIVRETLEELSDE